MHLEQLSPEDILIREIGICVSLRYEFNSEQIQKMVSVTSKENYPLPRKKDN